MQFQVHTPATAPEASRPLLEQVQQGYGFIPSVYGILAESPVATSTYIHITERLKKHSNYSNHIAHPPLDPQFEAQRWSRKP